MINLEWVKHGSGMHQLAPAFSDISDDAGRTLVTAYAAKRPDGEWSLMLINKDPSNAHEVKIEFDDNGGSPLRYFSGTVTAVTFGAEQYVWHPQGAKSHADPDGPPATNSMNVKSGAGFTLPKASVTFCEESLIGIRQFAIGNKRLAGAQRCGQLEIGLQPAVDLHRSVARADCEFALAPGGHRRHAAASQRGDAGHQRIIAAHESEAIAAGTQFRGQIEEAQQSREILAGELAILHAGSFQDAIGDRLCRGSCQYGSPVVSGEL